MSELSPAGKLNLTPIDEKKKDKRQKPKDKYLEKL